MVQASNKAAQKIVAARWVVAPTPVWARSKAPTLAARGPWSQWLVALSACGARFPSGDREQGERGDRGRAGHRAG